MKLFLAYLKQRRFLWLSALIFGMIFAVSFQLYHLPPAAILYPSLLCVGIGIAIMLLDFRKIRKEHRILSEIDRLADDAELMLESLPKTAAIQEQDYQALLRRIIREHRAYRADADRKYRHMIDYYTVWVHQIKTPIAAMKLHLQNEDSTLSRTLLSDLHHIEQYVEMVLTFLRLNADSTDYIIQEYDLDPIVKQAVKKFSSEFIQRKLTLIYQPLGTTVITDKKWLAFVIEQVLSNAIKYTPPGGSITITLESPKRLRIRDTGIGIAPEDLPRIFENTYTGYNGRTDSRASGIGLYLCHRICDNLHHTISAQSVLDVGTVIDIDLARPQWIPE